MSPELNIAHNAALKASKSIEQMVFQNVLLSVQKKLQNDYVQKTHDVSLNDLFFTLKRAYPEDVICLDEKVLTDHSEAPRSWHLLPLDGATNLLYGIPHCAITMLLCEQKIAKQVFIFHPFNGDIFTATHGKGAFFNQRRMRLDQVKEAKAAVVATNLPGDEKLTAAHGLALRTVNKEVADCRILGCPSLDLAWVAAGKLDAYWQLNLSATAIRAGQLMITEAGGQCLDFNLSNKSLSSNQVIAGNLKLTAHLGRLIKPTFSA